MIRNQQDYRAMQAQLMAIEQQVGPRCYLHDEAVDAQNADMPHDCDGFWNAMCISLICSADGRADEQGIELAAYGFNHAA